MKGANSRRLSVISTCVGLSLMATCSTGFAKSSKDNLKVGIFSFSYSNPAVAEATDAAMEACKARGWTCEAFDGKQDMVATSNAGVNFVNRKFDAIIDSIADNHQLGAVIKAANAANIPYVSIAGGLVPGITADVDPSGHVQGALLGGAARSAIDAQGTVALVSWTVLPALRERSRGFKAAFADDKNVKIIEVDLKVPGEVEDSYKQITSILQSNKDLKAIMVGWNELSPGAARALEIAGLKDKVKVYGYDSTPSALDLMRKEGSPLVGIIGFSLAGMGRQAVSTLADAIDGKPVEKVVTVRSCIFTKDNLPPVGTEPDYKTCTPFTAEIGKAKD